MSVDLVKVLIVDDDVNFLKMMKETFESKNCYIETAGNQNEALSILLNQPMHIVFIDCVLLSEQGMNLVKKIREHIGFSLDIIMMSGIISQNSISNYVDTNITGFVQKPISNQKIEFYITKAKEKLIFGSKDQFLLRVFDQEVSPNYKLKYLISLEQAKSANFLLILLAFLDSKEPGHITFSTNTKDKHKISFKEGAIINYSNYNPNHLLNYFIEKGFLSEKESEKFKNINDNELINQLMNSCFVSPSQVTDAKINMLEEVLKQIMASSNITFKIKLFVSESEDFCCQFSKDELVDSIFKDKNERFNNSLDLLFDEQVLQLSLKFKEDVKETDYHPEIRPLVAKLKTGLKLGGLTLKDGSLYKSLFYILGKGKVAFFDLSNKFKYMHLYERYENLYKFFKKKDSYLIFQSLGNREKNMLINDNELVHHIYLSFMKFNHFDNLPEDLPREIVKTITEVVEQLKYQHDTIINPQLKQKVEEDRKTEKIEKEMILVRKKQSCKNLLEKGEYQKALAVLQEIPDKLINQDIMWQLFYLWLQFSDPDGNSNEPKVIKYLQNVAQNSEIKSSHVYHYVLGLYYESKKNYKKAFSCYENTKLLEPSFKAVYPAIKRIALTNKMNRKKKFSFLEQINISLSKKKKAS